MRPFTRDRPWCWWTLSAQLSSEHQTAWLGQQLWPPWGSAASAGVLQRGGQALSAAARLPEGPGNQLCCPYFKNCWAGPGLLGLQGLIRHPFFFFFFWVIMDVLELFKRGGWNNEHQHPPLGCGSLMTANCSAHCPLPWVAVGKTSDLTPLALSYTLSEHRAALFFLSSTLVWHPELPPPWLLAQPCAPSPQCCCWCVLKMQA